MVQKRKHQSFLHGSLILMGATALVKVIGALFKIPLNNLIGGYGMGFFSTAYDLYMPIYALAMAGLPVAVSRIVAEHVANKRFKDVKRAFKISKTAFFITGITGFIIMVAAAIPYTSFIDDKGPLIGILCIAPSLFFCCVMSAYRGYYEGLRNMYPTAVSSVIEALGKLFIGYGFAYAIILKAKQEFFNTGFVFGNKINIDASLSGTELEKALNEAITKAAGPYAAAGAILGITIGTALGALYLLLRHRISGDKIDSQEISLSPEPYGTRESVKVLIAIAIPVVLGSLVTNIASLIDVAMVQRQLSSIMKTDSATIINMYDRYFPTDLVASEVPAILYGCYKSFAYPIYNLIPTITAVLGISALPVLATAWTEKNRASIKLNIESMIRIIALIALPAGFGIASISGGILNLLYDGRPGEVAVSTPLLTVLGITGVFAGLMAPMTNMLQAIGKQKIPVRNIAVGALLKIIINYILVGMPSINIMGAPIGTLVCYVYIFSANLYCLVKYSGVVPNFVNALIKPLAAALMCGVSAWASYGLMENYKVMYFQDFINPSKLSTITAIVIGGVVYLIALATLRVITKDDVLSLPKGEKIAATLEKIGIIK